MRTFTKIIGACCNHGQPKIGTHIAPAYLYDQSIHKHPMRYVKKFDDTGTGYRDLYNLHNSYLHNNNKVITIGGDHSISLSTVASSVEKYKDDLVVVWVDAHPDLNTRASSLTQNIHGMPMAFSLGLDNLFDLPTIKPNQLIYLGIRDIDPYEQHTINTLGIESYNMTKIKQYGLIDILNDINRIDAPIHLSFDVDSIDPRHFKSTGTPVPNGFNIEDVWNIFSILKKNIVSTDIVEFNPYLSNNTIKSKEAKLLNNLINFML